MSITRPSLPLSTVLHAVPGYQVAQIIDPMVACTTFEPFPAAENPAEVVGKLVSTMDKAFLSMARSRGGNAIVGLTISVSHDGATGSIIIVMYGAFVRLEPSK